MSSEREDPITREAVDLLAALVLLVDAIPNWGTTEQRAAMGRLSKGIHDLGVCRMREYQQQTAASDRLDAGEAVGEGVGEG